MKNLAFLLLAASVAAFVFCKNEPQKAKPLASKAEAEKPKIDSFAKPAQRGALPADATCFRSKDKDGQRTWELRMVKMDEKGAMRGDLLVTSNQSTEFAQGRIDGLKKDGPGFFGTWVRKTQPDQKVLLQRVSYLQKGKNLIERSQTPEDDGRIFEPCACADLN